MIDISLTEEQELFRETVTSFASEQLRPAAREADESCTIPQTLVDQAWELGLVQSSIPETHGGYGAAPSAVTGTVIAEGLANGDLALALHVLSPRLVTDPIVLQGSEAQQKEVLPTYCGAKFVPGSAAVMEPVWNFNFTKPTTTAKQDGENWVISGKKCNVPLAKTSPFMVVYATCDDGTVGAFLVRQGTPGVNIGEREKNLGLHALELYEVEFDDCRVAAADRIGDDALPLLRRARVAQSAMAVGVAEASLAYAIDYAKDREAFGMKIAQKQAIAFMLADMATETEAARLLNWEAAWLLDGGKDAAREVALAHRYAADMVMKTTDDGLQVLGGHGFVRDHPVEMWTRNGRGFAILEGIASV
jgi:acyl-CoA dehydrogenase